MSLIFAAFCFRRPKCQNTITIITRSVGKVNGIPSILERIFSLLDSSPAALWRSRSYCSISIIKMIESRLLMFSLSWDPLNNYNVKLIVPLTTSVEALHLLLDSTRVESPSCRWCKIHARKYARYIFAQRRKNITGREYVLVAVRHSSKRTVKERKKKERRRESRYKVDVSSVRKRLIRRDRDSLRCERLLHSNQYSTHSYTYSRNPRAYMCNTRIAVRRIMPRVKIADVNITSLVGIFSVYAVRIRQQRNRTASRDTM